MANFITAGLLNANLIRAGKICGANNQNTYFDLDSGSFATTSTPSGILTEYTIAIQNGEIRVYEGVETEGTILGKIFGYSNNSMVIEGNLVLSASPYDPEVGADIPYVSFVREHMSIIAPKIYVTDDTFPQYIGYTGSFVDGGGVTRKVINGLIVEPDT